MGKLLYLGGAAALYYWWTHRSAATALPAAQPNAAPADISAPTGSTSVPTQPWQPVSFGGAGTSNASFIYTPTGGPRAQQNLYYPAPPAQMRQAMGRFGSSNIKAQITRERPVSVGSKYKIIDAEWEPA